MKKVKELLKFIKGTMLSTKKNIIIASSIIGLIVVGAVAGGAYIWYRHNTSVLGQGKPDPSLINTEDIEKTDKEKEYDKKVTALNSMIESVRKANSDFKYEDKVSEENVDELLKKYTDMLTDMNKGLLDEDKKNEEAKAEADKKREEITQDGNSSSGSGSSGSSSSESGNSSSGGSGGSSSTPKPEPTVPSKPSGWRQDIASSILSRSSTPNTNSTSGDNMVMTSSQLSNLNSWSQQWLDGSISSSQLIVNASNDKQEILSGVGLTYLSSIVAIKETFNGDDYSTMYPRRGGHHYIWCRAYYDGNSNTTTVYMVSGTMTY